MQRSSGSIGSLAAALAKAQAELTNPEKSLVGTIRSNGPGGAERDVSIRVAVKRARHRAQGSGSARNRYHADDVHRSGCRHRKSNHSAGACVRVNGLPRTGRSAPLLRRLLRIGWELR